MDALPQDLRVALRSLAASPGFTAIAASCIAIGIAANVFIWTPLNTLLLRPLPFPASEQLVQASTWRTEVGRRTYGSWSVRDYEDLTRLDGVFSGVGAHVEQPYNLGGGDEPERLLGARVTASLFPTLGLTPLQGRFFRPEEEVAGARVVVLGSGVWERQFAADPGIVGRTVLVDGAPHTVVGIMQRGVRYPEVSDLWVPFVPGGERDRRDLRLLQVTARLAPGITLAQADARVTQFMDDLAQRFGDSNTGVSGWLVPVNDLIAREVRPLFLIMLGAVGFVLLIACANVANLLLARGASRQREVAVRLSLGATRGRIVRQFLTESLLLAVVGGIAGTLLGVWGTDLFVTHMMPTSVPYWMTFDVDRLVLAVTLGVTVVCGLLFGVVPALSLSRPALGEALKSAGGRGNSAAARAGRTRSTLVVTELALSLVLLVGAGLMMRSFLATHSANLGFDRRGLLSFQVALSGPAYASDSARATFARTLEERLRALPGVRAVGAIDRQLIADCCRHTAYAVEGNEFAAGLAPRAFFGQVSPGYLATMRIPLRQGRDFADSDLSSGGRVALVDELFATREWPGQSALGRQVRLHGSSGDPYTVVGVIPHLVTRNVTDEVIPQLLVPLPRDAAGTRWYALRTDGDPDALIPAVRTALRALDATLPIARAQSMDFTISDRMFQPRVFGSMFTVFAAAALLLATIGLYGVMSYLVAQRRQEMGIRMALGATGGDVTRLVLRGAARLIAVGLGIGFPLAIGLSQLLRGALFGVSATDPLTLAGIPALLLAVALLASWMPARRATRVDPVTALRAD